MKLNAQMKFFFFLIYKLTPEKQTLRKDSLRGQKNQKPYISESLMIDNFHPSKKYIGGG